MRIRNLLALLVPLTAVVAFGGVRASAQQAPCPSAVTKLTGGLLNPGGMKVGPDGMLYVAEAGTGGGTKVTPPEIDGVTLMTGLTGRISKIDPASGARTTVIDNLPSVFPFGGAADVAFLGTQLYYLHTFGGADLGFPGTPSGIYRVTNGTANLVADIGAFAGPDPFATGGPTGCGIGLMTVQDGAFYLVDSFEHSALKATPAGVISCLAGVANIEPTRVTLSGRGPFYVHSIAPFPHAPELPGVYSFPDSTGNLVVAADDLDLTDVEVGPGGQYVHALSIGGKVLKAGATGLMSVVVDGFPNASGLIFAGDTAYFLNATVDAFGDVTGSDGQVWKTTGCSYVTPPALPNTGTVTPGSGASTTLWVLALAAAALGLTTIGAAFVTKRR